MIGKNPRAYKSLREAMSAIERNEAKRFVTRAASKATRHLCHRLLDALVELGVIALC